MTFIVIACGAISGLYVIIATGTTPMMLGNERVRKPQNIRDKSFICRPINGT
ncbi:hypothetical protein D7322_23070 [Sphingobacterium puteale]|uniref:CstA N-terminal domain-containing protein n=1 Tax=Sphingobacterium puteale TaxID=2420510 RepID=A0A420VS21_9SPHI|nr:carbon starvation CstA family protein [Sphingobacterium puteale]RKO69122.1 hypothetical protein D7322_23070 [Sphingobacterium puteale]